MPAIHYLRIWLACVRYSLVRMMMFRADFIMWSLVEVFWVMVNHRCFMVHRILMRVVYTQLRI